MKYPRRFELKEEHITLLQNACWSWSNCETGAPCIDPKRPYGNSYVAGDIADLLGIEVGDEMDDDMEDRLSDLHAETETALEIILSLKTFETGVYVKPDWNSAWVRG